MNKFLSGFIKIEKSIQTLTLVSVMLLLGYLGFMNYRSDRSPSPVTSITIQK